MSLVTPTCPIILSLVVMGSMGAQCYLFKLDGPLMLVNRDHHLWFSSQLGSSATVQNGHKSLKTIIIICLPACLIEPALKIHQSSLENSSMGTVFSNRRGRANNTNNHPLPAAPPPAPQLVGYGGYVLAYPLQPQPYYHASRFNPTSFDPQAHHPQAHHPQGSSWSHDGMGPLPLLPPVEPQKVVTIRNDANLKKETLRLERDEENPGRFLLAFTFDATVPGSISIFFFAKEGPNCGLTSLKADIIKPVKLSFDKGMGQKFRQPTGSGIDLSVFDDKDLSKEGPDEEFPIAVRADASSTSNVIDISYTASEQIGNPLPKTVNCQITQAVIGKKDNGDYNVRVVRQILWVNGIRYELQEIYGIGNSVGTDFDDSDPGKECVICMSEPRDTMILPCRHMCLCSGCAKVLRFQTKRCPICRQPVERLLEMKVNRAEG